MTYDFELDLHAEEFRAVLLASTLGVRRPVDDLQRLDKMRQGIGKRLIAQTRAGAGGDLVTLILLAAPAAEQYYDRIDMQRPSCWTVSRSR